jgi:hypothetical protein
VGEEPARVDEGVGIEEDDHVAGRGAPAELAAARRAGEPARGEDAELQRAGVGRDELFDAIRLIRLIWPIRRAIAGDHDLEPARRRIEARERAQQPL